MKSKIAVLFLIVLLCLTSGCSNTSQIAEQPAPVSSSESNKAPYQSETAQATEKTEVEQPRSTEPKDEDRSTEAKAGVLDSSIQTKRKSISFLFREAEMQISTTAVLGDTPIFTI